MGIFNPSDIASRAPAARRIDTISPLSGGGDLTADRTITVDLSSRVPTTRTINTALPLIGGGALTADLNLTSEVISRKDTNQTINSGAYIDITGMSIPVEANQNYLIFFLFRVTTDVAAGYKFSTPAAYNKFRLHALHAAETFSPIIFFSSSAATEMSLPDAITNLIVQGYIYFSNGANAGNLKLQMKGGSTTVVQDFGCIMAWRIG